MKSDLEIREDVMAELEWEPGLHGAQVGVSVNDGVVMLSGVVDTYYKKVLAEKATKKVSGVRAVAEEIVVQVPGSNTFTDIDIAKAVISALKWNSSVDDSRISVTVEGGEVTLSGQAAWNFQKLSAQKAVENLVGVSSIINNIRVENKIVAHDVKQRIADAFERSAAIDSNKLNVEVAGDRVILTGTVRSFAEKMDAEKTAWSSPGVMDVDNRLSVDSGATVS